MRIEVFFRIFRDFGIFIIWVGVILFFVWMKEGIDFKKYLGYFFGIGDFLEELYFKNKIRIKSRKKLLWLLVFWIIRWFFCGCNL